jgi:hypothetical protein
LVHASASETLPNIATAIMAEAKILFIKYTLIYIYKVYIYKKRRAFEFFTLPSSFFTYSQALKLISKPFTLCVKAPTEMKSTPCSA